MPTPNILPRRQFLTQAPCAAIGSTSVLSTILNLKALGAVTNPDEDYKALVCVFLAGGNDSYNMLVPQGETEHREYQLTRGNLALPREDLLPLNAPTQDGRTLGLHPAMPEVKSLFDAKEAALVTNVGTLVEPLTKEKLYSPGAKVPIGLFSHADQAMHWQTSVPDKRSHTGFAGRLADLLHASNNSSTHSTGISLGGNNTFQTGTSSIPYSISRSGHYEGIRHFGSHNRFHSLKTQAITNILDATYEDLFRENYAGMVRSTIGGNRAFHEAIRQAPEFPNLFSWYPLSQQLRTVARTIAARQTLGMKRQTFFVRMGGWDHHDEVLQTQNSMLTIVSRALNQFNTALKQIGIADKVTTFTASDFARTLTSNGKGSDHAWGGNQIVMGGAVKGGQIYGTYPSLETGNPLDTGRGRLIPTTSTDEFFAEMALWFGASPADLPTLLPNITRFHTPKTGQSPLDFLNLR